MTTRLKHKEIQVQKPAQSLQAFQQSLGQGDAGSAKVMKALLLGAGILLFGGVAVLGWQSWRDARLERHANALADVVQSVFGDGLSPVAPADVEKRMRERLPELERLAQEAPGPARAETAALVAAWRLQLEGKGGVELPLTDPWSRLRLAQRQIALGQASEALETLRPLAAKADPSQPWASVYWNTVLDVHRLRGDRSEGLKAYAEYKRRYKELADPGMERLLASL